MGFSKYEGKRDDFQGHTNHKTLPNYLNDNNWNKILLVTSWPLKDLLKHEVGILEAGAVIFNKGYSVLSNIAPYPVPKGTLLGHLLLNP